MSEQDSTNVGMDEADELMSGGGGVFAPSFKFGSIGDMVRGEVTHVSVEDQIVYKSNPPRPVLDKRTNQPKRQIKVILQTELRDWKQVAKVPVDRDNKELPASEDDGTRAVYIKGWMQGAVGDAVRAAGKKGAPKLGGTLAVKFDSERDTGEGNPLKLYVAQYAPPPEGSAAADDLLGSTQTKAADTQPDPWQTATPAKSTAEDMPAF